MVYFGGKPSGGCERCRRRKIGCDKLPEGCTNCKKGGHTCSGYPNAVDLKFRDETKFVAQKFKKKPSQAKPAKSPTNSQKEESPPSEGSVVSNGSLKNSAMSRKQSNPVTRQGTTKRSDEYVITATEDNALVLMTPGIISRSLSPSLEDQAVSYFFTHQIVNEGFSGHNMDEVFFTTMKAVGLAGISSFSRTPYLKTEARRGYHNAIEAVNWALSSSTTATNDSTLMSILLLSQFETIDSCTEKSIAGWENHIKGAAAVLKLRGPERLKTPVQVRLFVQSTSALIIGSMKTGLPLPDYLYELANVAAQQITEDDIAWRFFFLQLSATGFRASLQKDSMADPAAVLKKAIEYDVHLRTFFDNSGPDWAFETIYADAYPDIIPFGQYHIYRNFLSAQIWNGTRSLRVFLNELIRKVLVIGFSHKPPLFSSVEHTAQFQTSTEALYQLQVDVLASLPQHFGLNPASTENIPKGTLFLETVKFSAPLFPWTNFHIPRASKPTISPWVSLGYSGSTFPKDVPMLRGFGGYILPWMLFLAGNMAIASKEIQECSLRLLRWVGHAMGIQQSLVLAEHLEVAIREREKVNPVVEYRYGGGT